MKKTFLRFTLFLLAYLSIRSIATAQTVDIPDPTLRNYIERVLGKAAGDPITVTEMATLTSIAIQEQEKGVSDLTGLDHAINLTELYLYDSHSISDISPVASLINLTSLGLGGNPISDISPVAGLTNLTSLDLGHNQISDISPVAGLTNLTSLGLGGNQISDISPVAGLTNLTILSLWENSISDITAVAGLTNLTKLYLWENSISDTTAVSGLTNLTSLYLQDNFISDITAIAGLTNLTVLDLDGNSISDITAVAGLTNLIELDLQDNFISDITAVSGLTNLTKLYLDSNFISDISAVTGLTNLRSLDLGYNLIFDLSPLVANTGLGDGDSVDVGGNHPNFPANHPDIAVLRERGVRVGDQLVYTKGLPNYPDPFRLETWIPYQLREDALVTLTIYDSSGRIVRTLDVGHQIAGIYTSRFKAAYWDGRNELGEQVASGIYFYHLSAGHFSITERMVILR